MGGRKVTATKSWWYDRNRARDRQTWVTESRNDTQVGFLTLSLLGDLEQVFPLASLPQLGNKQAGLMISKVPPGLNIQGVWVNDSWSRKASPQDGLLVCQWWGIQQFVNWKLFTRVCLCNPMAYTVHGIFQARILKWVAFPFSRRLTQLRDWTQVSCIAGRFFTSWATREAQKYWSG